MLTTPFAVAHTAALLTLRLAQEFVPEPLVAVPLVAGELGWMGGRAGRSAWVAVHVEIPLARRPLSDAQGVIAPKPWPERRACTLASARAPRYTESAAGRVSGWIVTEDERVSFHGCPARLYFRLPHAKSHDVL